VSKPPLTADKGQLDNRLTVFLNRSFGALAAVVLVVLVILTCSDVFGRYVLNAPIPGTSEMVEQLMGLLIFLALPAVTLRRSHITIDLLDSITPRAAIRLRDTVIHLICAAFLGAAAYRLWGVAATKVAYGDITQFLHIPLYPIAYLMLAMTSITCVLLVLVALRPSLGMGQPGHNHTKSAE